MAKSKAKLDHGPCPICGRAVITLLTNVKLADEAEICCDCAAKRRVMDPLAYGKKKGKKKIERLDPLEAMTLDEVRAAMEKAPEHLEDLRAKYGRNAVFAVEDISMYSHGWFMPPYISAKGKDVFGFFDIGDEVEVLHAGASVKAKILDIEREIATEKDADAWIRRGEGGYPIKRMVFSQKDLIISPGDLIVKG